MNLAVSDVHATSCLLRWDAPEDDGGAPLLHYTVEQQDVTKPGQAEWREIGETVAGRTTFKCTGRLILKNPREN